MPHQEPHLPFGQYDALRAAIDDPGSGVFRMLCPREVGGTDEACPWEGAHEHVLQERTEVVIDLASGEVLATHSTGYERATDALLHPRVAPLAGQG